MALGFTAPALGFYVAGLGLGVSVEVHLPPVPLPFRRGATEKLIFRERRPTVADGGTL